MFAIQKSNVPETHLRWPGESCLTVRGACRYWTPGSCPPIRATCLRPTQRPLLGKVETVWLSVKWPFNELTLERITQQPFFCSDFEIKVLEITHLHLQIICFIWQMHELSLLNADDVVLKKVQFLSCCCCWSSKRGPWGQGRHTSGSSSPTGSGVSQKEHDLLWHGTRGEWIPGYTPSGQPIKARERCAKRDFL
jgi:hypothetical protein